MDLTPDELLMLKVRDGDVQELAILYDRHRTRLYNFLLHLTGQAQVSEDLVQDVFLRMLKYRHTFEAGNRFTTWMYRIARNVWHDHRRKRRHEVPLDTEAEDDTGGMLSPEPGPDSRLGQKQDIACLKQALARLSSEDREVLALSRFQNLKYHEIATVLECGVGAVKMRVHRALKQLRERFSELAEKEKV